MKTTLSYVLGILQTIGIIAIIFVNIVGPFHAIKSHSTVIGIATIFVPPLAWYYGLEFFFWHKEGNP